MPDSAFLPEEDWRDLLREIHDQQVIPIVGPELITVPDHMTGGQVSLYDLLVPQFANALGVSVPTTEVTINRVACDYLLTGGKPKRLYSELSAILDKLNAPPPQALLDLASITDFDLYLSGTIDPMMAQALEKNRPGFRRADHVKAYDYKRPVDLPENLSPALVYHLLGNRQTYPNFAVWEEDYLEFITGLVRHHAQLERLFLMLKTRYLLVLGAPFNDWIVRLFLFVVKGGRFTDRRRDDVQTFLADKPEHLGAPLIFFFDQVVGTTRIIRGSPVDFVAELARRWRAEYSVAAEDNDPLTQMPEDMPRGAVFVSYSRDDLDAVRKLVGSLRTAQIPVWVDKQRLQAGENYERSLEFAVKNGCSFFLSCISQATEADPTRFVHRERKWAAQRHVDGFVFYLPVALDDIGGQPKLEPPEFSKIHFDRLPGGEVTPAFISRLQSLVAEWRLSGQPRA